MFAVVFAFLFGGWSNGQPAPAAKSVKGPTEVVDGLKVTTLTLPAKPQLACVLWADAKGSAFLTMEAETGLLRRVSFPKLMVETEKDLDRKFNWMSLSKEGLLLSDPSGEKVWLLDPETLELKAKIAVPQLGRAASAPGLSVAIASDRNNTPVLYLVDLKTQKTTRGWVDPNAGVNYQQYLINKGKAPKGAAVWPHNPDEAHPTLENPAVSPDGDFVYTENNQPGGGIARFSFKKGKLVYEDNSWDWEVASNRTGGSLARSGAPGITFSPDLKYVCRADDLQFSLRGEDGLPIYSVAAAFPKHHCVLEPSTVRMAVGFDPKTGSIYTQSSLKPAGYNQLAVFSSHGVKKNEYKWGKANEIVLQYLVHPDGNQIVMPAREAGSNRPSVYVVEVPKQN
jgi:hypothetical protein